MEATARLKIVKQGIDGGSAADVAAAAAAAAAATAAPAPSASVAESNVSRAAAETQLLVLLSARRTDRPFDSHLVM